MGEVRRAVPRVRRGGARRQLEEDVRGADGEEQPGDLPAAQVRCGGAHAWWHEVISCLCNLRHGRPEGAVRGGGRAGAAGPGHPAAGPHPAGAGWPGERWLVEAGHVTPIPTSDWSRAPGCRCRSPALPPRAAPPRHPASRGSAPQVRSPSSSSSACVHVQSPGRGSLTR